MGFTAGVCDKCGGTSLIMVPTLTGLLCKFCIIPPNMTPSPTIRIFWDTSIAAYRVSSPYNETLVDFLSKQIPVSDRSYDTATRIWTIVERQLAPLENLLKMLNFKTTIITRAQAEAAAQKQAQTQAAGTSSRDITSTSRRPLDAVILEFVRMLPYDAAKAAYRRAAIELHPDKNPDNASKMSTLNTAWTRIEKEVYNQ